MVLKKERAEVGHTSRQKHVTQPKKRGETNDGGVRKKYRLTSKLNKQKEGLVLSVLHVVYFICSALLTEIY